MQDVDGLFEESPSPVAEVILGIMNAGATPAMLEGQHRTRVQAGWMAAALAKGRNKDLPHAKAHLAAASFLIHSDAPRTVLEFLSSSLKVSLSRQRFNSRRDKLVWKKGYTPPSEVSARIVLTLTAGAPTDVDAFVKAVARRLGDAATEVAPTCTHPIPAVYAAVTDTEVVALWERGVLTAKQAHSIAAALVEDQRTVLGISIAGAKDTTAVLPHAELMASIRNFQPTHPLKGTVNELNVDDAGGAVEDNVNWVVKGAFQKLTETTAGAAVKQLNLANEVFFVVKGPKLVRDIPDVAIDPKRGGVSFEATCPNGAADSRLTPVEQCRANEVYYDYLALDVGAPDGMVFTRHLSGKEDSGMCPETMGVGGNIMSINTNKATEVEEHCESTLAEVRDILVEAGAKERTDGSLFIMLDRFRALPHLG